jgi:hypothetical protein
MSQQTQKQKDDDALAKNNQAYGTGQKKVEIAGFKTPDTSNHETQDNLDRKATAGQPYDTIKTAKPAYGKTTNDSPTAKEAAPAFENDEVDAPARMNATGVQADAKRDATPIQKPALVNEDQTNDTE